YRRGMNSGHSIGRPSRESTEDIHIEWRVYVCCILAQAAKKLPRPFFECGVKTGVMSLAGCEYIDFNAVDKDFYLFDTYSGVPLDQLSEPERNARGASLNNRYFECWDLAVRNFAPYRRARLIRGRVPDTLASAAIDQVCYLAIDM